MAKYQLSATLSSHKNTITALNFSSDGRYLASGSEDGTLLIFSTQTWLPIKHYVDASSVTAILWHPTRPGTLVCGFLSGDVLTVCLDGHCGTEGNPKFWTDDMNTPVGALAFDEEGIQLAIGHGRTVTLTNEIALSIWRNIRRLPDPPTFARLKEPLPVPEVRSLHFIERGRLLLVSYLDHGVVCWDTESLSVQWQITLRTCNIGCSAVSPDEKSIVVSNLFDGLDWYAVSNQWLSHTVPYPINLQHNVPVPVKFTDDGMSIIVGGTCGSGRVLDASTFETVQMLPHDGDFVQAIDLHHRGTIYLVAAGVSELGTGTSVKVWISEVGSPSDSLKEPQPADTTNPAHFSRGQIMFNVLLTLLSIACCLQLAQKEPFPDIISEGYAQMWSFFTGKHKPITNTSG